MSLKIEECNVQNGSKQIFTRIYRKEQLNSKQPVVIFSHWYGGTGDDLDDYAQNAVNQGFIAIAFDFCGGGPLSRSSGKTTDMSIFTEKEDLLAIIDFAKNLNYVDSEKFILAGASQGGTVSAITANEIPQEILGLVLFYPAFIIPDDARSRFNSVDQIPETVMNWMPLGRIYFQDVLDYDIYQNIREFKKPVLIIHGDNDGLVPIRYSKKANQVYQNADLRIIHGAGHGFYGSNRKESMKFVDEFLKKMDDK